MRSPAARVSWREYCSQQAYILYTFVGLSHTYLIQLLLTYDAPPPAEVPPSRSDPWAVEYRPLALHRPPNSLLCACLASSLALCLLLLGSEPCCLPHRTTDHGAAWLADRDRLGWYHWRELCGDGTHRSALPLLWRLSSPFFPPVLSPSLHSFVVRGWLRAPDIRAIDVNLYLPYLAPSAKM